MTLRDLIECSTLGGPGYKAPSATQSYEDGLPALGVIPDPKAEQRGAGEVSRVRTKLRVTPAFCADVLAYVVAHPGTTVRAIAAGIFRSEGMVSEACKVLMEGGQVRSERTSYVDVQRFYPADPRRAGVLAALGRFDAKQRSGR